MAPQRADTSGIHSKFLDVPYAAMSPAQTLDLYLPNDAQGPYPLIIEIHGGGFMLGSKSADIGPMLLGLQRGYALASINYRLSSEAKFPAAVNDVKAAIRFLRANAAKYQLDANRFATWGGSAGGNLSAMAALSGGVQALSDPALGLMDTSDRVQAAIVWFGPIDFGAMDAEFAALGTSGRMGATNAPSSAESRYLGQVIGTPQAQTLVQEANPLSYLTPDDPPLYVQHGTADRNIPITQSVNFAAKAGAVLGKDQVRFEPIEGADHGGARFNAPDNAGKILDFLDQALKRPRVPG
ncbi:alpha/beta hydrolase [Rhodoferax aquaticus]|uniref:Alpha/beta hydrolase n=2 Tax=Rhodoferax aquaticus TaxID=2527691 RepID=A0A515EW93_9BURK|nr:alpha/beta hydrolase [Rhodoferax aquaticus]